MTALEWNSNTSILASAATISNQNVVNVCQASESESKIVSVLRIHRRRITSLSWSSTDPTLLSSASMDNTVCFWDLRDFSKPQVSKINIKGNLGFHGIQLKWNRLDALQVAQQQMGQVHIWDLRNMAKPTTTILADASEIHSLDWSYTKNNLLLTSSLTKVKFWNIQSNQSIGNLSFEGALDKVSFTPFSSGITTSEKNTGKLFLYSMKSMTAPTLIDTFQGVSKESFVFNFRKCSFNSNNYYQIVAWGPKACELQYYCIDPWHIEACGEEVAEQLKLEHLKLSGRVPPVSLPTESTDTQIQTKKGFISMEEEWAALNENPVVGTTIKKMDKQERSMIVQFFPVDPSSMVLELLITFPSMYPYAAPPAFTILNNSTGTEDDKLKGEIVDLGDELVFKSKQNCIRECLQLVISKFKLSSTPKLVIEQQLAEMGDEYETYVVARGDQLSTVALTFRMGKSELRSLNKLQHSGQLVPGKVLIVKKRQHNTPYHHRDSREVRPTENTLKSLLVDVNDVFKVTMHGEDRKASSPMHNSPVVDPLDPNMLVPRHRASQNQMFRGRRVSRSPLRELIQSERVSTEWHPPNSQDEEGLPMRPRGVSNTHEKNEFGAISPNPTKGLDNIKDGIMQRKVSYVVNDFKDKFEYVSGKLTILTLYSVPQLIFEPDLNDAMVKLRGVLKFSFALDLLKIQECSQIKPTDDKVDFKTESFLLICSKEKKENNRTGIYYFRGDKKRIEEVAQKIQVWSEQKRNIKFLETLNLETATKPTAPSSDSKAPLKRTNSVRTLIAPPTEVIQAQPDIVLQETTEETQETETPAEEDRDSDDDLIIGSSILLEKSHFRKLRENIPYRFQFREWKKVFSTETDGTSLTTFYSKLSEYEPSIVIIEDSSGYRFGGYASECWTVRGNHFFGTGECFVFSILPTFAVYKWTTANDYFMVATKEFIGMGGGTSAHYAFYLDAELNCGTSEVSNTFLNRRLSATEEFRCTVVEAWAII
uniref:Oxidation resistance protein 1 n=1 Tax=Arcella intermedia TaxID=1963864 RepID=A0A6B2KWW9_9EUKA